MKRDTFAGIFLLLTILLAGGAAIFGHTQRVLSEVIFWGGIIVLIGAALILRRYVTGAEPRERPTATPRPPPRLWPALLATWCGLAFLGVAVTAVIRHAQQLTPTNAVAIIIGGALFALPPLVFAIGRISAIARHRAEVIIEAYEASTRNNGGAA